MAKKWYDIDDVKKEEPEVKIDQVADEVLSPVSVDSETTCQCGGKMSLAGKSQDATHFYYVYQCDKCKAHKHERKAKE